MKKYKDRIFVAIVGLIFASMTFTAWIVSQKESSESERRKLAQFPELSYASIKDGSFMTKFENYTQDQFPLRDAFRTIKAVFAYYMLGQLDNNDIYMKDGYAAKLEYPLNEDSVHHAADRFEYIYNKFLADKNRNIYLSIVPDKSYFLAEQNGYLRMDYEKLFAIMQDKMSYANYIDITTTLDITDYYKTDTHWRQEKLNDTAAKIAAEMGVTLSGEYTQNALEFPFYGVYYGQVSLPLPAETIYYLTNDILDSCKVTNYEDGTVGGIYDMDRAVGKDPYEIFLSGSRSLITIENPNYEDERELIIFRDSFGSSITPLLVEGYSKITLVDIRYLRVDFLDKFIEFDGQDVLFLFSTLILNNSETLT
ncbi:MAG: hypothetical protein HFI75_04065 [Lachnospiraceae bacterium]|nr:hypothetical protein [Lachnospiraceae bacterium]